MVRKNRRIDDRLFIRRKETKNKKKKKKKNSIKAIEKDSREIFDKIFTTRYSSSLLFYILLFIHLYSIVNIKIYFSIKRNMRKHLIKEIYIFKYISYYILRIS